MSSKRLCATVIMAVISMGGTSLAQSVQDVTSEQAKVYSEGAAAQAEVNQLDDARQDVVASYKQVLSELEAARIYNGLLIKLIDSQKAEEASLNDQIERVSTLERDVTPLMLKMVETIGQFVDLDVPFLGEERAKRVENLNGLLVNANASNAEKFRRILEAYQIENEYGRTIEAYRAELTEGRRVDFLRLGRVALIYQTLDAEEAGYWDASAKAWVVLDESYRTAIRQGLRIARKQAAPDLLILPTPAPQTAN